MITQRINKKAGSLHTNRKLHDTDHVLNNSKGHPK
jgi:hypothetical protein